MPNLNPIPERDLPPIDPSRNFFYCPHPLEMTDAEVEANFPRERRIAHLRDLAAVKPRLAAAHPAPAEPQPQHTALAVAVLEKA